MRALAMFILDLRHLLVGLFVILFSSVLLALALDRRYFRKRHAKHVGVQPRASEMRARPFLGDLAHELRTPLAVLLTHLEAQRSATISPETRQESLHLMQAEARRMSRMVSNILELAELETRGLSAKRLLDLRALASQVISEIQPLANEREITLRLDAADESYWIIGDSYYLKQVLLNLADNALKYSRPRDCVEISLERDAARIKILCAVCDSGPGIAAEHLLHVTRRFYRAASEEISGSGLGLALVAAILELHGSELEIESKTTAPETGTCMRFALDAAQEFESA